MARRGQDSSDKLHNRRKKALAEKDFKAKKRGKTKVPDIIISCEDSVSAPTYLNKIVESLIKDKKITQDSFVIVPHDGGTNPKKVLERLKSYEDANGKTYKDFQYKWIVIDRDIERVNGGGHTADDFNATLLSSKNNRKDLRVDIAYANDSFELWYLLHFDYICTPLLRDELNVKLIEKLKVKNPYKFSKLDKYNIKQENYVKHIYDELLELQSDAIRNAENLLKNYAPGHNPEQDNPSTTIHLLIDILKKLA